MDENKIHFWSDENWRALWGHTVFCNGLPVRMDQDF